MNDGYTCTDSATTLFTPTHRERSRSGKEGREGGGCGGSNVPQTFGLATAFFHGCLFLFFPEEGMRDEGGRRSVLDMCVSALSPTRNPFPYVRPPLSVLVDTCRYARVHMSVSGVCAVTHHNDHHRYNRCCVLSKKKNNVDRGGPLLYR